MIYSNTGDKVWIWNFLVKYWLYAPIQAGILSWHRYCTSIFNKSNQSDIQYTGTCDVRLFYKYFSVNDNATLVRNHIMHVFLKNFSEIPL